MDYIEEVKLIIRFEAYNTCYNVISTEAYNKNITEEGGGVCVWIV